MAGLSEHWDAAYALGDRERGWYQGQATTSMALLEACDLPWSSPILDVGSGASVFVDDALATGYQDLTALDASAVGLAISQARLGDRARDVTWVHHDLRTWGPPHPYRLWHDRAVLHFLLEDDDRAAYRDTLMQATASESWVILGGFRHSGPNMCAGLPVRKADAAELATFLGPEWQVVEHRDEAHIRPDGGSQDYVWVRAQRH